jgi:hypothetical protein
MPARGAVAIMATATVEITARLRMARIPTLRFGQDAIHCAAIAGLAQGSMINVTNQTSILDAFL